MCAACLWLGAAAPVDAMTILELAVGPVPVEGATTPSAVLESPVVRQAFRLAYAVEPQVLSGLAGETEDEQQLLERLSWAGFATLPEFVFLGVSVGEARVPFDSSDEPADFVFEEDFRPAAFSH